MTEYSKWIKFFKDASIPPEYVETYAKKFAENRIRFDLLADLDRPLLNEMGITAIGDCLSILKHAKSISSKVFMHFSFHSDIMLKLFAYF